MKACIRRNPSSDYPMLPATIKWFVNFITLWRNNRNLIKKSLRFFCQQVDFNNKKKNLEKTLNFSRHAMLQERGYRPFRCLTEAPSHMYKISSCRRYGPILVLLILLDGIFVSFLEGIVHFVAWRKHRVTCTKYRVAGGMVRFLCCLFY